MLKKLLIALFGLISLLLLVSFLLPRHVHLERSIEINAPQATVFALVNGFARFNEWSPWAGIDPATVYAYEGPSHGVGAHMSWESDHQDVGSGKQTITSSTPFERVESDLDFGPQGTAKAFFALEPKGESVSVTWGFDSDLGMNPIGRWFGLLLDKFLGPSYEQGLAQLKTLAESLDATDFATLDAKMTTVQAWPIAFVKKETPAEYDAIGAAFAESFAKITAFIAEHQLTAAGSPLSINHEWNEEAGTYVFDPAIPLAAAPAEGSFDADGEVKVGATWQGQALKIVHTGPYDGLPQTYEMSEAYIAAYGLKVAGPPWETWINDPSSTPAEELITEIYFPLE